MYFSISSLLSDNKWNAIRRKKSERECRKRFNRLLCVPIERHCMAAYDNDLLDEDAWQSRKMAARESTLAAVRLGVCKSFAAMAFHGKESRSSANGKVDAATSTVA